MIILCVIVFHCLPIKSESIFKLYPQVLIPSIGIISIVIRFLPFLGKVIYNVKYCKAEIRLPRSIRAIDNTILNDIVLDGIQIEFIVAVPCEVQLNLLPKSPEIFYGKLGKHSLILLFLTQI